MTVQMNPATGRLLRAPERKLIADDITRVDADGTFSGYASVFGVEDLSRDIVEKGAFLASLSRRGPSGVKMLYQHDPAEPIGRWTDIRETSKGLKVTGQILADVSRGREVLYMMREGILDGLSIGFRTVKARSDRKSGIRRLLEVDLWEISIVTFPMQPDARVAQVKSLPPEHNRMSALARELALADRIARLQARISAAI